MFTQEELNNLAVFMGRVQIEGKESIAHAVLMQKIGELLKATAAEKEEKK